MVTIDYNTIQRIFNDKTRYHIGYLNADQTAKVRNFPIKEMPVEMLREKIKHLKEVNGICLIITQNRDGLNNSTQKDYENRLLVLESIPQIDMEAIIALAKKPAVVEAGMAQYGRNQVTYDEYFGFDSQIDTFFIHNPIINLPKQNPPKWGYMDICKGCHDCANACPAHAIHNETEPAWVDGDACRDFCGVGDHDRIITVKYKLNQIFNNPPFPDEVVKNLKSEKEVEDLYHIKWIGERFYRDSNGINYFVNADICRECCVQPKCSKYNGKFPYNTDPNNFILQEDVIAE